MVVPNGSNLNLIKTLIHLSISHPSSFFRTELHGHYLKTRSDVFFFLFVSPPLSSPYVSPTNFFFLFLKSTGKVMNLKL